MNTIVYYIKGEAIKTETISAVTLKNCHGMKIKCTLLDGTEKVGYANSYYSFEDGDIVVGAKADLLEYITLETFANLDEETHRFSGAIEHCDINREKVLIKQITHVDALLYSGPRWGRAPTNRFV